MSVEVWVINLPQSIDRAKEIGSRLNALGVRFTLFPAIHGERLSEAEARAISPEPYDRDYGRMLRPGEIGCAASHLAAMRRIAEGDQPFVCVLEDDAVPEAGFLRFLSPELLSRLPEFDVLRLFIHPTRTDYGSVQLCSVNGIDIYAPLRAGWGMLALIYSRAGARKILQSIPPLKGPIDTAIYCDSAVKDLRVIETKPGVFTLVEREQREANESVIKAMDTGLPPPRKTVASALRRNLFMLRRWFRMFYCFARSWGLRRTMLAVLKIAPRADAPNLSAGK